MMEYVYKRSSKKLFIVSVVIFTVFLIGVLPLIDYWMTEIKHLPAGPDTVMFLGLKEFYEMRMSYGSEGRDLYILLRWTFDVVWPIVYLVFYLFTISYLGRRVHMRFGSRLLIVPILATVFDFLENIFATIFMAYSDLEMDFIVYMMIGSSFIKWVLHAVVMIIICVLIFQNIRYDGEHDE